MDERIANSGEPAAEKADGLDEVLDRGLLEAFRTAPAVLDPEAQDEAGSYQGSIPERLGEYRILGILGQGGMGVVYRAEQEFPQRPVALKVVRPHLATPSMLRRFAREAELLGLLVHPGIARVYSAGTFDVAGHARPYLAMELVDGVPLSDWLEEAHDVRARVELVARVAEAVQAAHQKGVLHRDLKPANILVEEGDQPRLVDFGLARTLESDGTTQVTQVGALMGTLPYMSPEQVAGDAAAVDTRSDVYALGVVLYEALCGKLPLDVSSQDVPRALLTIVNAAVVPLGRRRSELRGDLETIAGRALEKRAEDRYASAAQLAADLRRFLRDEPIQARPPSALYQLRKLARRHRVLFGLSLALLLALVGGGAGVLAFALRADEARAAAVKENHRKTRIHDLLVGILEDSSPYVRGANTPVVELLRGVGRELDVALSDDPVAEAGLRTTLARAFREMGLGDEAAAHAQRAYDLFVEHLGPEDEQSFRAEAELARTWIQSGASERALPHIRSAADGLARVLGPDHPETLMTRADLVPALRLTGRLPEALAEARADLTRRLELFGEADSRTAFSMGTLSELLSMHGDTDEALSWSERALAVERSLRGPSHPHTLEKELIHADNLLAAGRAEEAVERLTALRPSFERALGAEHPRLARLRCELGSALVRLNRSAEAEPHLRFAAETFEGIFGPGNETSIAARLEEAVALRYLGRTDEALERIETELELARESLPEGHPLLADLLLAQGFTWASVGDDGLALASFRDSWDLDRAANGAGHPRTLETQHQVYETLRRLGRLAEAAEELESWVRQRGEAQGEDHPDRGRDVEELVELLRLVGRNEDADAWHGKRPVTPSGGR